MSDKKPDIEVHVEGLAGKRALRVGCVSFLNARPLIESFDDAGEGRGGVEGGPVIKFDVPSALLDDLVNEKTDVALCPVIDFQLSERELLIVPVGGIGCDGPTLTVRIYSRVPIREITRVHMDTDSHTSVCLTQVILRKMYDVKPEMVKYTGGGEAGGDFPDETYLLIGDKVVANAPSDEEFAYQLDLGQSWKELTGLPFVFAVWMTRPGVELGDLPVRLEREHVENKERIGEIAAKHAREAGWPVELAEEYLGQLLKFGIDTPQLQAMQLFYQFAYELGIVKRNRGLAVYQVGNKSKQVDATSS